MGTISASANVPSIRAQESHSACAERTASAAAARAFARHAHLCGAKRKMRGSKTWMAIATSILPEALAASTSGIGSEPVVAAIRQQLDQFSAHRGAGHAIRRLRSRGERLNAADAGQVSQENLAAEHRRRGGGERGEDCARSHRPVQR